MCEYHYFHYVRNHCSIKTISLLAHLIPGKIAAQCSHATLACYKRIKTESTQVLRTWEHTGQTKVAVQVKSERELETLQAQAWRLGLVAELVHDAGRTQIASGTATVLGVGPGPNSVVDRVTGGLRLL